MLYLVCPRQSAAPHKQMPHFAYSEEAILTNRERQILSLTAQGRANGRIVAELNLAEQTVRNYVSRIYTRLGVESRVEAVVWAREHGLA
jgi:DNA-binding NarL/FixJ family response regulator